MRRILASLVLCLLISPASAGEVRTYTVKKNTRTGIATFARFYLSNCLSAGLIGARLAQDAAHGSAELKNFQTKIRDGVCAGSTIKGLAVFYTPQRGYSGVDQFELSVPAESNDMRPPSYDTVTFRITVQ
jgi:hypothetical protein